MFPQGSPTSEKSLDYEVMGLALELARSYVGRTGTNPSVGAVVVKNGKVIGRGFHRGPGHPHAETVAIDEAGPACQGADLYVTLEPCNTFGRTPPCTENIVGAGVKKVVCGTLDPNPAVAGGGLKELRACGVEVVTGVRRDECRQVVEGYAKYITTGLPWVTVKYAMSLDGKVATRSGDSFWITGEGARESAHRLRSEYAAVLVGAGTVRRDDPRLTVRLAGRDPAECPVRVIVSSDGAIPGNARVLELPPATWVITARWVNATVRRTNSGGAEFIVVREDDGRVDLADMLRVLGERGITSVLVEGGPEVIGGFLDRGLTDKVVAYVAPRIIGGRSAKTAAGGEGVKKAAEAIPLKNVYFETVDDDFVITGYITDVDGLFPGDSF